MDSDYSSEGDLVDDPVGGDDDSLYDDRDDTDESEPDNVLDEADDAGADDAAEADIPASYEFIDSAVGSAVVYSEDIIVVHPDDRQTSNIMNKNEVTEHNSIRAVQISQYDDCMVDNSIDDPIKQAQLELIMRKSPLILRRFVGERLNVKTGKLQKYCEDWSPNEMGLPVKY